MSDDFSPFGRLALIGIGLIGSSIAINAKARGLARHIAISTRSAQTLARAEELGLGDSYHRDAAEAVRDADLVILCVPVGSVGAVTQHIANDLKPGSILSDVGSVKGSIVAQMSPHVPEGVHLVPAHPIAGTEQSGPDAGFLELFEKRWCILTPIEGSNMAAVARLKAFWEACGSDVEEMAADHHDLVLAITSHLPHLIAYNIVGTAYDLEEVTQSEVVKYSASGFRDFTRLASSDPTMWRDVFLNNREATLEMLARFSEDLSTLQRAIRDGRGEQLFETFTKTRAIRRQIIEAGQETAKPNFGRNKPPKKWEG
ncbi:prephenate/arogenate dehydrogenase family protein [Fulvimarina sp. 2208YS6-2-32]|uniref:Prephenate/arogenate dehydrogenase family protein n=1 Tax=Fulvimarina uroteuthidis TaxID=3098149 RepID=A0ABU5I6K6_9HYPH|nr:prephenate/arogenate dehydrogenase family protein [Fulvimarina sp. 2208YS6-2-32]MDY8109761.1 prephenate/arogenate dehydrogenase family protein [Fulvimarina sp. 2208YS6-2-32]